MEFYVDKYSCKLSDDGSFEVSHSLPGGNDVHNFGSLGLPVEKLTSDLLWAATSDDEHYDSETLVEVAERQLHYYFWKLAEEHDWILEEDWDIDALIEYCRGKRGEQGLENLLGTMLEAMLIIYGDDKGRLAFELALSRVESCVRSMEERAEVLKAADVNNLTPSERLGLRQTLEDIEVRLQSVREVQRQILEGSAGL